MCQIPGMLAGNIFYMMEKINQMRVYLPEEHLHKFFCPEEFRDKFLCPEIFWHISLTVRIYSCIEGISGQKNSPTKGFFVWMSSCIVSL